MVHYTTYNIFVTKYKYIKTTRQRRLKMQNKNFDITENNELSLDDMIACLEEYYECAGFEDFYERMLKGKSEEVIREMYLDLKRIEDAPMEDL